MDKFDLSDITIAIVSFKSEEIIENSIKSINPKIPIIVVENSNNNNFKENLEKNFKNVKCILAKDNVGYSVANNIAINNSITKLVFIINPDVELLEGTMDRLWLMSKCKNHIISNSSFYWWAAWLSEFKNKNSIIIASNNFANSDTIPDRWEKL